MARNTTVAAIVAVATTALSLSASNTAVPSNMEMYHEIATKSSWSGLIARLILSLLQFISTILYYALTLTTISIPTLLFTLLSSSLTVTMNATTLLLLTACAVSLISWFIRYRYLNMYSRLPHEPQRKEKLDLFSDTESGTKSGSSNYLDEFLSAIKIFGYMERPVLYELTRSMQTRKLIAGETLNLEDEKGFCVVVDGLVEVFVKSTRNDRQNQDHLAREDSWDTPSDDESQAAGQQSYQLLTEVRNGASLSSLFTIMSLFTEDITLDRSTGRDGNLQEVGVLNGALSADIQPSSFPATPISPQVHRGGNKQRSHNLDSLGISGLSTVPPFSLDSTSREPSRPPRPIRRETTSAHPDILARATIDTTIAVIPASAFRRLIRLYPKATAHIVHVILSRFQRVTLATAFDYLGLKNEVSQIEKSMGYYTTAQIPNVLRGEPLEELKEKFRRELDRAGSDEIDKGIALHNSKPRSRRRSSTSLRREAVLHAVSKRQSNLATTSRGAEHRSSLSIAGSMKQARGLSRQPTFGEMDLQTPLAERTYDPFAAKHVSIGKHDSANSDGLFRLSILECVFTSIGLTSSGTTSRGQESSPNSPRLVSYDTRRQQAFFSSNPDSLDGSLDGESESAYSGNNVNTLPDIQTLAQDMQDDLEIVFFPKDSVLVEQGERNPGIFYVLDGFLDVCLSDNKAESSASTEATSSGVRPGAKMDANSVRPTSSSSRISEAPTETRSRARRQTSTSGRRSVTLLKPGSLAGYVGSVTSYRSFHDVVAKTDVYVGFLPIAVVERLVDKYPVVLLTIAKRLTNVLPRMLRNIDFALDWAHVNAGQILYQQGDDSDAIYLILNGRLRLVVDQQGEKVDIKAEFGQGNSVGELEVLTETNRPGTLHAIRDSEVVRFPRLLFNSLAQEHPSITLKISRIVASRMRNLIDGSGPSSSSTSHTSNIRTVAIIPVTEGVPVADFGTKLVSALNQVGLTNGAVLLDQAAILNHLGKHAFNRIGKLRLSQYLADLEEKYSLVVSMADTKVNSPWTQTCITQADCILLVGLSEGSPEIGEYERFMLGQKSTARKILVLLHAERYSKSGLTRSWLKSRSWVNSHFHVQMDFKSPVDIVPPTSRPGSTLKQRVQIIQAEIQKYTSRKPRRGPFYSPQTPLKGDFYRLARRLCGKSVGLVLGGGGARGFAEIGVIRAMEDAGIPIDIIGGTSMGAFVGGLYARHADVVPILGLAKKFAGRMSSTWRFALDLTYPTTSYTTGHVFNRGIFKIFGTTQIEDFWIEYYANTTNLSKNRAEIHTSGYAWRYIRASMSLAGLLPPLCDEGDLLLDGGYVDNLTVAHMKSLGVETIFAVDVGSLDDNTPNSYGESLSGMWAVFNRWNPLSSIPNPPTLAEIQARLAYISSFDVLERAKNDSIFLRPPIDKYGTLDWGKFDEITRVGYEYATDFLQKLREKGALPLLVEETDAKKALRRTLAPRRASV